MIFKTKTPQFFVIDLIYDEDGIVRILELQDIRVSAFDGYEIAHGENMDDILAQIGGYYAFSESTHSTLRLCFSRKTIAASLLGEHLAPITPQQKVYAPIDLNRTADEILNDFGLYDDIVIKPTNSSVGHGIEPIKLHDPSKAKARLTHLLTKHNDLYAPNFVIQEKITAKTVFYYGRPFRPTIRITGCYYPSKDDRHNERITFIGGGYYKFPAVNTLWAHFAPHAGLLSQMHGFMNLTRSKKVDEQTLKTIHTQLQAPIKKAFGYALSLTPFEAAEILKAQPKIGDQISGLLCEIDGQTNRKNVYSNIITDKTGILERAKNLKP